MITCMEVAGRTGAYGVCHPRLDISFVLKSLRKYQKIKNISLFCLFQIKEKIYAFN